MFQKTEDFFEAAKEKKIVEKKIATIEKNNKNNPEFSMFDKSFFKEEVVSINAIKYHTEVHADVNAVFFLALHALQNNNMTSFKKMIQEGRNLAIDQNSVDLVVHEKGQGDILHYYSAPYIEKAIEQACQIAKAPEQLKRFHDKSGNLDFGKITRHTADLVKKEAWTIEQFKFILNNTVPIVQKIIEKAKNNKDIENQLKSLKQDFQTGQNINDFEIKFINDMIPRFEQRKEIIKNRSLEEWMMFKRRFIHEYTIDEIRTQINENNDFEKNKILESLLCAKKEYKRVMYPVIFKASK